jgi:hypothetical protein
MNYWVIEKDTMEEEMHLVKGPFKTKEAAKKWAIDDCKETFESSADISIGENKNWSSEMMIVQEVETIKPIPIVSLTIKL